VNKSVAVQSIIWLMAIVTVIVAHNLIHLAAVEPTPGIFLGLEIVVLTAMFATYVVHEVTGVAATLKPGSRRKHTPWYVSGLYMLGLLAISLIIFFAAAHMLKTIRD
jgi:hypothetical protein